MDSIPAIKVPKLFSRTEETEIDPKNATTSSSDQTESSTTLSKDEPASTTATKEKVLDNAGQTDTTVEKDVAPTVEHETIKRQHETREQEVVDRERHQHHYHTTVQPLKDREVEDTKHDAQTEATEYREINKDNAGPDVKGQVAKDRQFHDTVEQGKTKEISRDEGTVVGEQVHHHLHETVQPVIEKETIKPSVTHVTKPVKEVVHEGTQNHGVTTNKAISVDEFQGRLDGEKKMEKKVDGETVDVEKV